MIPTDNDIYGTYLASTTTTTNEHFNMNRIDSDSRWMYADEHDNRLDIKSHLHTSRTDKPRLAHEIYSRWVTISSLRNDQVSGKLTHTLPLSRNDLLMAAYSGSNLMYRK